MLRTTQQCRREEAGSQGFQPEREPPQLQGRPTQAVQEGGGRVSGIPAREGAITAQLQGIPTQAVQGEEAGSQGFQ